jgi:hypothetical protein
MKKKQSMRADGANTRICNSTSPPSTSSDYCADYRCSRTIAVRAELADDFALRHHDFA